MAATSQVRSGLLATVGLIWLGAVVLIVAITLNSPGSTAGRLSAEQQATYDRNYAECVGGLDDPSSMLGRHRCYEATKIDPGKERVYDARSAALRTGVVTVIAAVLTAATLIWTRRQSGTPVAGGGTGSLPTPVKASASTVAGRRSSDQVSSVGTSYGPGGPRRLSPEEPILALDLADWDDEEIRNLVALLRRERVPHDLTGDQVLIEHSSEAEVEALIDTMIRSTKHDDNASTPTVGRGGDKRSAEDIASELRQVKLLHDEGILTDEEYEQKRKALADQL